MPSSCTKLTKPNNNISPHYSCETWEPRSCKNNLHFSSGQFYNGDLVSVFIDSAIGKRWSSEYKTPVFINICKDVLKEILIKIK